MKTPIMALPRHIGMHRTYPTIPFGLFRCKPRYLTTTLLNQPLTAIVHYTGGCIERLTGEHVSDEIINVMRRVVTQAERAGAVIHRLKDFLRKGGMEKTFVDINAVIRETLSLMEVEITEANIDVQLKLFEPLPCIKVDKIQLEQVEYNNTKLISTVVG